MSSNALSNRIRADYNQYVQRKIKEKSNFARTLDRWLRWTAQVTISTLVAMLIALNLSLTNALLLISSSVQVLEETAGATVLKGFQRMSGSYVGGFYGAFIWIAVSANESWWLPWAFQLLMVLSILVFLIFTTVIKMKFSRFSYFATYATVTATVIIVSLYWDYSSRILVDDNAGELSGESEGDKVLRIVNTAFMRASSVAAGLGIAMFSCLFIFPRKATPSLRRAHEHMLTRLMGACVPILQAAEDYINLPHLNYFIADYTTLNTEAHEELLVTAESDYDMLNYDKQTTVLDASSDSGQERETMNMWAKMIKNPRDYVQSQVQIDLMSTAPSEDYGYFELGLKRAKTKMNIIYETMDVLSLSEWKLRSKQKSLLGVARIEVRLGFGGSNTEYFNQRLLDAIAAQLVTIKVFIIHGLKRSRYQYSDTRSSYYDFQEEDRRLVRREKMTGHLTVLGAQEFSEIELIQLVQEASEDDGHWYSMALFLARDFWAPQLKHYGEAWNAAYHVLKGVNDALGFMYDGSYTQEMHDTTVKQGILNFETAYSDFINQMQNSIAIIAEGYSTFATHITAEQLRDRDGEQVHYINADKRDILQQHNDGMLPTWRARLAKDEDTLEEMLAHFEKIAMLPRRARTLYYHIFQCYRDRCVKDAEVLVEILKPFYKINEMLLNTIPDYNKRTSVLNIFNKKLSSVNSQKPIN